MTEPLTPFTEQFLSSGLGMIEGVYNNMNLSDMSIAFNTAVDNFSANYNQYKYTSKDNIDENLLKEIEKKAKDIEYVTGVAYEVLYEFLILLVMIDSIEEMQLVVNATGLEELLSLIGKPYEILALSALYKIAYLADAIINILRKFEGQFFVRDEGVSLSDMISSIVSMIGGNLGAAPVNGANTASILGQQLSKMLHGVEIPMGIQTNNPNLTSPSILGKLLFGEAPSHTALIDMNQLLAKPIAVFGDPIGGSGNAMFSVRNVGSLSKSQSIEQFVANTLFGGNIPSSGYALTYFQRIVDNLTNELNVSSNTNVEMKRGDNAIPVMFGLAQVLNEVALKMPEMDKNMRKELETITSSKDGVDNMYKKGLNLAEAKEKGLNASSPPESPLPLRTNIRKVFPLDLFAQGWKEMNSVMNQIQSDETFKKVLFVLENS